MKVSILLMFTLGLAVGSFGYPSQYTRTYKNNKKSYSFTSNVSPNEVETLVATIAGNEHLNEIFAEVLGVNITALNTEVKTLIIKSLEAKNAHKEKLEALIRETSLGFRMNVALIAQKFKIRLFGLFMKGMNTDSAFMQGITRASNTLGRRLINLVETPEDVKKEDVVKVFEAFMNTKLKSTIREDLNDAKLILGVYFLWNDMNEAVLGLAKKEGPEVEADFKTMFSEFEEMTKELLKPLIDLLKPAFLPEYEPLFLNPIAAHSGDTDVVNEVEDSEDKPNLI